MTENFIAIDIETANQSHASICQIALVGYAGSNRTWEWSTLVDPEEEFDQLNIDIHGISSLHVQSAPKLPDLLSAIGDSIGEQVVASHTPFDCNSLNGAARKYGLNFPQCRWIDTCEISRFAWPELSNHKLDTLCQHFSIPLDHHNALSDAIACGEILTQAVLETRLIVQELAERVGFIAPAASRTQRKSAVRYPEKVKLNATCQGPLSGHVLVCTGEFSIGKAKLATLAAGLGCDVEDRFSKKRTTILVIGHRDPTKFNGKQKSKKQLDAEATIESGRPVSILSESEFLEFIGQFHAS